MAKTQWDKLVAWEVLVQQWPYQDWDRLVAWVVLVQQWPYQDWDKLVAWVVLVQQWPYQARDWDKLVAWEVLVHQWPYQDWDKLVAWVVLVHQWPYQDWDKLVAWVVLVQQWPHQDLDTLVAWVVPVQQWPYRTSWIVLHAEDLELKAVMKKREKLSGCVEQGPDDYMDKKLLAIFKSAQEKQKELEKKGEALKRLNSLDGDTELLELFLQEFDFSVQDMFDLLPVTTNLDSSIKMAINSAIGQA
ncbi:uncharacterized protein LOC144916850 [Branchiostoma floridae x Branchiostoma belcheri]